MTSRPLAVVSGGAGLGIGSGVAKVLARDGWDLLIVDRDHDMSAKLKDSIEPATAVECLTLDLLDDGATRRVAEFAQKWHGTIEGLVNNVGIGCVGAIDEIDDDQFDNTFAVNLKATFRLTRELLSLLKSARGSIVNMSSVHGKQPHEGFSVYAATKGAIEAMTRGWAVDFGKYGVRVNCVAPGMVDCPQTREVTKQYTANVELYLQEWASKRQLLPNLVTNSDVGELVSFLLGPRASGITGQTILIDAGTTLLLTDRD